MTEHQPPRSAQADLQDEHVRQTRDEAIIAAANRAEDMDGDAADLGAFPQTFAPDAVVARIQASAPRRVIGSCILAVLGSFSLYLALQDLGPTLAMRMVLGAMAGFSFYAALLLWKATGTVLELTPTELREENGRVIAKIDAVESVTRGTFAFKPSSGFLLVSREARGFVWAPGMWWRVGSRVGVGGVTPGMSTRYMAEVIADMLAVRRAKGR